MKEDGKYKITKDLIPNNNSNLYIAYLVPDDEIFFDKIIAFEITYISFENGEEKGREYLSGPNPISIWGGLNEDNGQPVYDKSTGEWYENEGFGGTGGIEELKKYLNKKQKDADDRKAKRQK